MSAWPSTKFAAAEWGPFFRAVMPKVNDMCKPRMKIGFYQDFE